MRWYSKASGTTTCTLLISPLMKLTSRLACSPRPHLGGYGIEKVSTCWKGHTQEIDEERID